MIEFIGLIIIAIPLTAIADYFAFKDRFKKELGEPIRWHYFIVPCALELGCFAAGYILGSGAI